MPTGEALAALKCIEKCVGLGALNFLPDFFDYDHGTDCTPDDLKISGGSECTPLGQHTPLSDPGSKHCTNQAFDINSATVNTTGRMWLGLIGSRTWASRHCARQSFPTSPTVLWKSSVSG